MSIEKGTPIHDFIPQVVDDFDKILAVSLIVHPATWNWRQENQNPDAQIENLEKGLKQTARPMVEIPRADVINQYQETIRQVIAYFSDIIPNTVVSLCSRVTTDNLSEELHLPMMNYHPEGVEPLSSEGLDRVMKLLGTITDWDTYVFETDRYWHSYGKHLMTKKEWYNWLGLHSNATSLVSPRYIGQSIRDGVTPLRQVGIPDSPVKSRVPHLVRSSLGPETRPAVLEYKKVPIKPGSELLKYPWKIVGRNSESVTTKRTSRVIIVNEDNQVLLTKRSTDKSYGDMWHIPGGRAEGDETPEETAVREIREELGITLETIQPHYHYYSAHKDGFDVTVFTAHVKNTQKIQLDGTENSSFRWFSADLLPNCAFSDTQVLNEFFGKKE